MAGKVFESFVLNCRVIDGDSVEARLDLGHYVQVLVITRLMGIDTPERSTEAGKQVAVIVDRWFRKFKEAGRFDKLKFRSASLDKYRRAIGDFFDSEHPEVSLVSYLRKHGLCLDYDGSGQRHWSDLTLKAIEDHASELITVEGTDAR